MIKHVTVNKMFRPKRESQNEVEFVIIDHGRLADPTMLFKMMFIGYFYDIRSEH